MLKKLNSRFTFTKLPKFRKRGHSTLLVAIFTALSCFGQTIVAGKVIDAETQKPLFGATIIGVGTSRGATTDSEGLFELKTQAAELEISFVGYATEKIPLKKPGDFLEVKLTPTQLLGVEPIVVESPIDFSRPSPVFHIPLENLQRDNQVSIAPALNRTPGLYMHSGALNTNRITIRGIGSRSPFATTKIRAYLDDIPLTSGIGETTIEDIDLSLIDEVTIWKGPTASIYGAGLGGMIHLKTKNKIGYEPTALSSSLSVGSYGLVRNVDDFTYRSSDSRVNLNLNYNNTHSDGYRANNEYDRESLTFLGQIQANDKSSFTFLVNYIDLKAFIPSSLSRKDFDNNPRKAAFGWAKVKGFEDTEKLLAGISYSFHFNKKFSNYTSLFTSFRNSFESRPFNILKENSTAVGARTRFEFAIFKKGLERKISLGGEFFNENFDWSTFETNDGILDTLLSDNEETRRYFNLFAEAKFDFTSHLFLETGLNLNSTRYDLTDLFTKDKIDFSGQRHFEAIVSPRLNFGYRVKSTLLFTTVSHGFSAPTLEETLMPDGLVNPDIQPERGWNFEAGNRGRILSGHLQYELSVFSMHIKDLLVTRRTTEDQFFGINAGKTTHNGLELFVKYALDNLPISFFTTYAYSHFRFDEFIDGDKDFSGNKLTGTAPHILNAGLDFKSDFGFYGNLNYQFVAAMPITDDNSIFSDSYQLMNAKLGFKKAFAKKWSLDLYAGINNLWNEKYASMLLINARGFGGNAPRYFYPGLPRNYYGGLSLKFEI